MSILEKKKINDFCTLLEKLEKEEQIEPNIREEMKE